MARQMKMQDYHFTVRHGKYTSTDRLKKACLTNGGISNERKPTHNYTDSNETDDNEEIMTSQESNLNDELLESNVLIEYMVESNEHDYRQLMNQKLVKTKEIRDNVHGFIEFEPVCMDIINTRQFQRLRRLAQLGCASQIFPGANHNRFQHSIGVAYLAEKFVKCLRDAQEDLGISDVDVLCVKIAGLCHDLGHGPFSHVFDGPFFERVNSPTKWKHEQGSVDLFDYLLKANKIDMHRYGLSDVDLEFIKEMITGSAVRRGRPSEKHFLYDIVNNTTSGLDVDKIDYFIRDANQAGVGITFEYERLFRSARVLPDRDDMNRKLTICFEEKCVQNVVNLFETRFKLHDVIYQHKSVKAIEYMIVDALELSNEHFLIPCKDGRRVKISQAYNDMEAYTMLNDSILDAICLDANPKLEQAKELLQELHQKKYKCIGKVPVTSDLDRLEINEIKGAICHQFLDEKDIIVEKMNIHYGKQDQNPVNFVRFYSKNCRVNSACFKLSEDQYKCPVQFREQWIRVFVRKREKLHLAKQCFREWSKDRTGAVEYACD